MVVIFPIVRDIEARTFEDYGHWREKAMSFAPTLRAEATPIFIEPPFHLKSQ
jgi:hypothetical protein